MTLVKSKPIGSYIVIAISLVLGFFLWSTHAFAGTRPTNIGVNNGKLAVCAATPNCVSSQTIAGDVEHSIDPLKLPADSSMIMASLKQVIGTIPRSTIIKEKDDYLYVESTSKLMGFVDDLELYIDRNSKTIQVRSASRLGDSDFGVNRQRVEEIRTKLAKLSV